LTNWQTFYKNLVINVLVIIVFFNRSSIKKAITSKGEWEIVGISVVMVVYLQNYNYKNLHVENIRAWKVRKNK
ncbi:MAG: hypothetical protein K8S00_12370, partial [Bacteroidales bacterium]|nr:hypothetical protein [Bacteroidales bacterium]